MVYTYNHSLTNTCLGERGRGGVGGREGCLDVYIVTDLELNIVLVKMYMTHW